MAIESGTPQIKYEGFQPDSESETWVQQSLLKILDSCPYDSRMLASIVDEGLQYRVTISVVHQSGKFDVEASAETIIEAVQAANQRLGKQLEEWRIVRFKDKNGQEVFDVLLVDDDPISIKLLEACFHQYGCRTVAVPSGERALEKVGSKKFDLIVMDWNMPRLDGEQTLKALDRKIGHLSGASALEKLPVLTYSVYDKNKIEFPSTQHLFRFGHMSKLTSFQTLQSITSEFLRRLKRTTTMTWAPQG